MPKRATLPLTANGPTPPERKCIRLPEEWQKSGLQGYEWCRRRGLKESAFRFWKVILRISLPIPSRHEFTS